MTRMEQLATPALVIEAATVERNLERMAAYADEHDLDVRPHAKTHKSQAFRRRPDRRRGRRTDGGQGGRGRSHGRRGRGSAGRLSDDRSAIRPTGWPNWPGTSRSAWRSIRLEAAEVLAAAARRLSATLGILVDVDMGLGRTGVQSPAACAQAGPGRSIGPPACGWTASAAIRATSGCRRPNATGGAVPVLSARLAGIVDLWADHGLEARIISGGSTPTAYQSHLVEDLTEIRPGTYVFNDMNLVRGGFCSLDDCAARIVATVVSTAVPGQFVLDAGSKTLSSDRCVPAPDSGHGYVLRVSRSPDRQAERGARPGRRPRLPAAAQDRRAGDGDSQPHLPGGQPAGFRLDPRRRRGTWKGAGRRPGQGVVDAEAQSPASVA